MAQPNPFVFTGSKIPQSSSSDASLRARLARLERENTTLQRELRNANDANGVARVQAAAKNNVQEAQRETKRAQMAERIARKIADDLLHPPKMAQKSTAAQEDVLKIGEQKEHSTANGKLQVESETDRGLPADTSDTAGNTNEIHAECQRNRAELIEEFRKLCDTTNKKHANDKAVLEGKLKTVYKQFERLEEDCALDQNRLKALKEEVERNAQAVALSKNFQDNLRILGVEHDELRLQLEDQIEKGVAQRIEENKQQQKELSGVRRRLDDTVSEIQGLKNELAGYEEELCKVRSENAKFKLDLEHQRQLEEHLSENNERLLADLQDEQHRRNTLVLEYDELKVRFSKTCSNLEKSEKREVGLQEALATSQDEFASICDGLVQQQSEHLVAAQRLITEVAQHSSQITARDQRIETLERENEALRREHEDPRLVDTRSISAASHNFLAEELLDEDDWPSSALSDDESATEQVAVKLSDMQSISIAPYDVSRPQLTVSMCDAVATTPRVLQESPLENPPVNIVSIVEPSRPVQPLLDMYHRTIANFAPAQPANSASIDSQMITESFSPVDSQPKSLAVLEIRGLDCGPTGAKTTSGLRLLQTNVRETLNYAPMEPSPLPVPAPEQLTMNVFNHSVINTDPKSGSVVVTDPHTSRDRYNFAFLEKAGMLPPESTGYWLPPCSRQNLRSLSYKNVDGKPSRSSISLAKYRPKTPFAGPSKLSDPHVLDQCTSSWPIKDVLTTVSPVTTIDVEPVSIATTTCEIVSTQEKDFGNAFRVSMLLLLLILLGHHAPSMILNLLVIFGALSTFLQLYLACSRPVSTTLKFREWSKVHYFLHVLLLFFCWRFWNQLKAWEQVNGVGFGEGFSGAYDDFGPYGKGHYILSTLPLNWVSADSQLPAKAVEIITSTVSAFEGLIGIGPTPSS